MTERLKKILIELLKIPSVSSNTESLKEVIDYVQNLLKNKSLYIERIEKNGKPSLYVSFEKNYNPEILFAGHLDVVPPDSEKQFEPEEKNGRIYARGALDMKGSCACMIEVILRVTGENLKKNVGFLFTTDEEVGSKDGVEVWVKEKGLAPKFAIIPDGGIGFKMMNEGKGVLHVRFKAKGRSAHGSTPWEGENAAEKLIDLYKEYKKWIELEKGPPEEPNWKVTLSLGKINAGKAVNIVPSEAEMELDFRFPSPWNVKNFEEKLREFLKDYKGVSMEVISYGEPFYTPKDNPYVEKFSEIVKEVTGKAEFGKIYGATDGRFFAEKGIPCIMVYPIGDGIHGKEEWVDIDSIFKLEEIFYRFIKQL